MHQYTPAWDDPIDDEAEDTEETEFSFGGGKDGLIFLIDATEPMFKNIGTDDCPFRICLECCKSTMLNKIIGSDQDLVGVVLFGTEKTDNPNNFSHITVLQDLEKPSATKIKQLENMLSSPDDLQKFGDTYGHSKDFSLHEALWLCQSVFSKSQYKFGSWRILLFTNMDNPHPDSTHKQHQARQKAMDLAQLGIDMDLLHLGNQFDPSLFYQELIQLVKASDDEQDWKLPDPSDGFEELLARVRRHNHKKRSTGRIHLCLGGGVKLGVGVYNLVRRTQPPKTAPLDRTTNEEVKVSTQMFHGDNGEILMPSDICKFQEYGNRKIKFTTDELRGIRSMYPPEITLIGFKPVSRVKIIEHLKPSSFIYPEENLIEGSRKLFAALLQRCLVRGVAPICRYVPRRDSAPRLVALLPQKEELDSAGVQTVPEGFHAVFLPFADDIRKLPVESKPKADPEQVEAAKDVIRKLKFTYNPQAFDNPKLQTHWSNIEALALDHNERREVEDYTRPDHEAMREKLGATAEDFLGMVYPDGYNPADKKKPSSAKRGVARDTERSPKRAKAAPASNDVEDMARNGKVDKLKVDELKAYLQNVSVKVTGKKKADLVTDVYNHLGIQPPK